MASEALQGASNNLKDHADEMGAELDNNFLNPLKAELADRKAKGLGLAQQPRILPPPGTLNLNNFFEMFMSNLGSHADFINN
jgi:hypothetical protein